MYIFRHFFLYLFDFIFHLPLEWFHQFHSSSFVGLNFLRSLSFSSSFPLLVCSRLQVHDCCYTLLVHKTHNKHRCTVYTHHFIHIYHCMLALAVGESPTSEYTYTHCRPTQCPDIQLQAHFLYFISSFLIFHEVCIIFSSFLLLFISFFHSFSMCRL